MASTSSSNSPSLDEQYAHSDIDTQPLQSDTAGRHLKQVHCAHSDILSQDMQLVFLRCIFVSRKIQMFADWLNVVCAAVIG